MALAADAVGATFRGLVYSDASERGETSPEGRMG